MTRTNQVHRAVHALGYCGVSVKRLAEEAGVHPSAITQQLTGKRTLKPYTVHAMCRLLKPEDVAFVLDALQDAIEEPNAA